MGDVWDRRAARARVIAGDDTLRGRARARAGHYAHERVVAEHLAADLASLRMRWCRVAATAAIAGLREPYETPEASADYDTLVGLVDRVLAFVPAGIEAG